MFRCFGQHSQPFSVKMYWTYFCKSTFLFFENDAFSSGEIKYDHLSFFQFRLFKIAFRKMRNLLMKLWLYKNNIFILYLFTTAAAAAVFLFIFLSFFFILLFKLSFWYNLFYHPDFFNIFFFLLEGTLYQLDKVLDK